MKKYISILLIFAACSSSTGNEPEPPAFESYRIGSWEVFAEKQAKWVGVQAAAKATDSTHFTQPDGFALYVEARKYAHLFPEDENHFQLALHDSSITEEPDWGNLPGDVAFHVETPFTEAYRGPVLEEDHISLEMGYIYDCEEPYELEGDEIIEFWNVFSGEKRTVTFAVDGYMDTIHAISCD